MSKIEIIRRVILYPVKVIFSPLAIIVWGLMTNFDNQEERNYYFKEIKSLFIF